MLSAVPVLLGISIIAFILGVLTPGDPARMALERDGVSEVTAEAVEAKREELGLNGKRRASAQASRHFKAYRMFPASGGGFWYHWRHRGGSLFRKSGRYRI